MSFRIKGLPAEHLSHLFALADEELPKHHAVRRIADAREPGYPCRVSLTDSKPGDELPARQLRALASRLALPDAVCHLRA